MYLMKICTVWIFDIGRGFASVIRTPAGKWIMIDLGARDDFNPVTDFMIKHSPKPDPSKNKRPISQLILTHPHNDHMTAIKDFDKNLYPALLTVPNDVSHANQPDKGKVNWNLVTNPSDDLTNYLRRNMFSGRTPPLRATGDDKTKGFVFKIYYLLPGICEDSKDLGKANYSNNISIMARLNFKGNVFLFCGDMMKDGMTKILNTTKTLTSDLSKYGVDFLITPHHGLRSSFSTELFSTMKGNRTRCLNIISEKPTKEGSNEIVDNRYRDKKYSGGHDVLINGKKERKRQLRTSAVGHIRINLYESGRVLVSTGKNALNML